MRNQPAEPGLPPVGIVVSRYNDSVTSRLLAGALDEYARRGGDVGSVLLAEAPGSFELPVIAQALANTRPLAAVVALGCIIRGGTEHHRYLGDAVARGLMEVSLRAGIPVGFGVLTVDSGEEALDRAGGEKGNKGAEAMGAALDAAAVIDRMDNREAAGPLTGLIAAVHDKVRGVR